MGHFLASLLLSGITFIRWANAKLRRPAISQFFSKSQKANQPPIREPRRLSLADQWACVSGIIRTAVTRTDEAVRCHSSAALQLDLAQYGLLTLVDELSAVMDMQGRRRRSNVHVLELPPSRVIGDAIAA